MIAKNAAWLSALLITLFLADTRGDEPPAVAKTVLRADLAKENLLHGDAWKPYEKGFERDGASFVCDNGTDAKTRRGVVQNVTLNQTRPEPIVASCSSKTEGVSGTADHDYSLYLDLLYTDGTPLWGQVASFSAGTHDWQRRQVVVLPEKPVKQVSFYMLLRGHSGKAWFRDPQLAVIHPPAGACLFDGLPVVPVGPAKEGFQIRDVAAGSDFIHVEGRDAGFMLPRLSAMLFTLICSGATSPFYYLTERSSPILGM